MTISSLKKRKEKKKKRKKPINIKKNMYLVIKLQKNFTMTNGHVQRSKGGLPKLAIFLSISYIQLTSITLYRIFIYFKKLVSTISNLVL
jgi:hypothetical protein